MILFIVVLNGRPVTLVDGVIDLDAEGVTFFPSDSEAHRAVDRTREREKAFGRKDHPIFNEYAIYSFRLTYEYGGV